MNHDIRRVGWRWILGILLVLPRCVSAQSLALVVKSAGEVVVETTTPADRRYVLQVSPNLELWMDAQNVAPGKASYRLGPVGGARRFFRLAPEVAELAPITVMLLGDSTVADFVSNLNYFNGWGQGIYGYFKPEARVLNFAQPGYSSRIFLTSDESARMSLLKPEYVLIQFGLIDEFGVESQHTTLPQFAENLRTVVRAVLDFGGMPILVTPPVRKLFDEQGRAIPIYLDRFAVIHAVAAELKTRLIDLNRSSMDLVNGLGVAGSEYLWWPGNYLHFSDKGAQTIAGLVVEELPAALGPYLRGNLAPTQPVLP